MEKPTINNASAFAAPVSIGANVLRGERVCAPRLAARKVATRAASRAPTMVLQEVEHGGKFLSEIALEKARKGTKIEKLKLEKDGSAIWDEIPELAELLRKGQTSWDDLQVDDLETRFKWAGLFHRKKRTPRRFMMRLKVPNGLLDANQMRYFARVLEKYGDDGCADITTRMNIQLRGIVLEDAGDICDGLYKIGLTSYMSGMDNVRNMVGSPIAGIDPEEIVDTRELCIAINDMITNNRRGNPALTNLPRKFNICVSGSRDDFAHTHINDVGLVPMVHPTTKEVGFNVVIGGFFSIKRNAEAIPMDVWLPYKDVVRFCETLLIWFRDNGDRKNRMSSRLMYMVDKLTMSGFREVIQEEFGSKFRRAVDGGEEYATPAPRRNVLGVHAQKQEGLSWVCGNVPAGRLTAEDFTKLADVAERYSNGEMRLTVEQNVLFPNVKNEEVAGLLGEEIMGKFKTERKGVSAGLVSCTGAQFCGLAIIETKNRAIEVARRLDEEVELDREVRMHWTGCPNSCGQAQVADIGLMGGAARKDGKGVEGVKMFLGGRIGEDAHLGDLKDKKAIPADIDDLVPVLKDVLIKQFGAKERK
ncbi:unnamed protein product [Chondrus crispus]|uniref:Ferredoxin--nitrite reductase, chloroplastic n=1 Tax=Chondrus crispus TaxID=2769 RepID=R7QAL9_CHOCR|nr:unnamed protein product [Chondrus crispus]CDF35109.1 unnamed protein product [Chondrus crispus]|eukprot:XP_005714928.1 unnamed protein product [Chondrus crispus]